MLSRTPHERDAASRKAGRLRERSGHLDASAQRLQEHIDNSPLAVIEFDTNFRMTRWSRHAERMFGWTAEEMLGLSMEDFRWVCEEDMPEVRRLSSGLLDGGRTRLFHLNRNYRKDGSVIYCEWYSSVIYDAEGRLGSVLSHVLEVTERVRAEIELRASRETALVDRTRLEAVVDAVPVGLALLDSRGGVVRTNRGFEQIWRASPCSSRRPADYKAWWVETGEPVRPEDWASAQAVRNGESVVGQLMRIQRFDGTRTFVLNSGAPICEPGGKVVGSVVAIQDVGDRVRAEQALLESEQRYRGLFASLAEGFALHEVVRDAAGRPRDFVFLEANPAFERQTGLRVAELVGRSAREALPGLDDQWIECFGRVARTGEPERFVAWNGQLGRWFEVSAFRTDPERVGAVLLDITERKRADRELAETRERLVLQEKLSLVGSLAGALAHELRGPLGSIRNATFLLKLVEQPGPAQAEAVDILGAEVDRAERIIASLLDFAWPRPPETRTVSVLEVLREAFDRSGVPEGIEIYEEVDESLELVVDPRQLVQVLGTLVTNAVQAMGGRGRLELRARRAGELVVFEVEDDGPGVAEGDLPRLFEPLFTTKAKGLGLGLAIARELVARNAGQIEVASCLGKGTTFTVRLPAGAG